MAILKCKMCGGDLEISEGATVCICEFCGTKQTVPKADDEKKIKLFERANRLRMLSEFDKAYVVYESIVEEFPEEAEAYWGLVLCTYGIEYVDDPKTKNKVPTCHRSSFDNIFDDANFNLTLEYSDVLSREVYRSEAKAIEELRRGIVEISSKEEPYDIFICYKETDKNGDRTVDSVIAQDIYTALTKEGYRVFFARISLEDKLGREYEPYIFSALHSSKVMLVVGTDYEHFNAVWVKNEWSRFLKIVEQDSARVLIPCYKDIDAYDMPREFAHLQAQDMGKVGAIQDLIRGVGKIIPKGQPSQGATMQATNTGSNVENLLKRARVALNGGDFKKAEDVFEKILEIDSESAEAYLGLDLVAHRVQNISELAKAYASSEANFSSNLKEAMRLVPNEAWVGELGFLLEKSKEAKRRAEEEAKRRAEKERIARDFEIENGKLHKYSGNDSQVVIPNGVMIIGDLAFFNCKGLIGVTIPDSVTTIGSGAFGDCKELTSITIPNSVTSIGSYAFRGCRRLTSITIPNSVTSIGSDAFRDCTGLTSITMPNSVTSVTSGAFWNCIKLTNVIIPDSVTSIEYGAFEGCAGLTSVAIPNSVRNIGGSAFSDCTGLTSITIPNSVTKIGRCAFEGCAGLTSIIIPNSVRSIGGCAFSDCTGLTSVTIPNSVTEIGRCAFEGCKFSIERKKKRVCEYCGGEFKGLFTKVCVSCGRKKSY